MKQPGCKECNSFSVCELSKFLPFPQNGCSDFEKRHKLFVLIHHYCETGFSSIVGFSDYDYVLDDFMRSYPRFGSKRHIFEIHRNIESEIVFDKPLSYVKDLSLINICKNVAEYLAVAEFAMLKKSYYKSSAWFEKAKNSAFLGSEIIDNY